MDPESLEWMRHLDMMSGKSVLLRVREKSRKRQLLWQLGSRTNVESDVNLHLNIHDTPDEGSSITEHANLALPLSISDLSSTDGPPDETASSIVSEKVLGANGVLLLGLGVCESGRNRVLGVGRRVGGAGLEEVRPEASAVGGGRELVGGKVGAALCRRSEISGCNSDSAKASALTFSISSRKACSMRPWWRRRV